MIGEGEGDDPGGGDPLVVARTATGSPLYRAELLVVPEERKPKANRRAKRAAAAILRGKGGDATKLTQKDRAAILGAQQGRRRRR